MTDRKRWRPALFNCPRTGETVQGLFADEAFSADDPQYEPISCLACAGVHFIDPVSGMVLGTKKAE